MRYIAPRRKGLTGRGKGRAEVSEEEEKKGREKGEVLVIALESEVVVLGNKETSVTGIKDFPDPTGLKPRGSSGFSD